MRAAPAWAERGWPPGASRSGRSGRSETRSRAGRPRRRREREAVVRLGLLLDPVGLGLCDAAGLDVGGEPVGERAAEGGLELLRRDVEALRHVVQERLAIIRAAARDRIRAAGTRQ